MTETNKPVELSDGELLNQYIELVLSPTANDYAITINKLRRELDRRSNDCASKSARIAELEAKLSQANEACKQIIELKKETTTLRNKLNQAAKGYWKIMQSTKGSYEERSTKRYKIAKDFMDKFHKGELPTENEYLKILNELTSEKEAGEKLAKSLRNEMFLIEYFAPETHGFLSQALTEYTNRH